jgi:hypothetical protein
MRGLLVSSLVRTACALAAAALLAACTQGGQFDPTELVSGDVLNSKKKIQGDREPLFPNGVPGAETGVPPDLVKGYQPPPEQQPAATADAAPNAAESPKAPKATEAKPKAKPKPKVAHAPTPPAHDPAFDQKPGSAFPQTQKPAQASWPNSPPPPAAATNWPAPSGGQAGAPAATNWPAPPGGQAQQAAPSAQTNWPDPGKLGKPQAQ